MRKAIFFLMLAAATFTMSCKKDAPDTCSLTSANLSGTYKMTSLLYKADANTAEVDFFLNFEACQRDDLYIFNTGGTYNVTEGATSCTPTNADNGTWSLNGTSMSLDTEQGEVSDFSCSGFKVKFTDASTGEMTTAVFAKQ